MLLVTKNTLISLQEVRFLRPIKKIIYLPLIITNTIKPFKNEEGEQKTRENGERECLCYLRFSERHISPAGFAKIRIFCYLQRKNRLKQR